MKTKLIKVLAVILVLISLFSFSVIASDFEKEIEPKTTYISSHSERMEQGLVSTDVYARITGTTTVTKVKINMELQKLSDGTYSTVETWTQTFTGRTGTIDDTKATNPLSTYRLKVTFTAYTSSTSETRTYYAYDA